MYVLPSYIQKGKSALMLAVREDKTEFYWFGMSEPPTTRVVSQLVKAGAALDLQDNISCIDIVTN